MADILLHRDFVRHFLSYIYKDSDSRKETDLVGYRKGRKLLLCPEPDTFLAEMDDFADNSVQCRRRFQELTRSFQRIDVSSKPPEETLWFNTTKKGINLRPGIDDGSAIPKAIRMGDAAVHGLMAGQTGSGKSVLLHNLIFNLLAEYPPWELDLYLADFKRVEFSRYMNTFETPHVCACAATGEVRYVLSLIQYLVDCMNAREAFFARMDIDKIANFRELYPDIVMPRILLIVDEFQQLFLEASTKEGEQIRQCLTAIVKKGRATGLHILFASQEMSQTLSRSDLSNFRIRFALNCNANVSMEVLGNRAASTIRRGSVIVNMMDGSEEGNRKFNVPFIETDEKARQNSYFKEYLKQITEQAEFFRFKKSNKFYQEELQEPWAKLEKILNLIEPNRYALYKESNRKYFDVLTLGYYVTYKNLRYDIHTLYLEYGRSKNILAISPKPEDIIYLQKLFALNFRTSPIEKAAGMHYRHEIYTFQPLLNEMSTLGKDTGQTACYTNPDDLNALEVKFRRARMLIRLFQESRTPMDFISGNIRKNIELLRRSHPTAELKAYEKECIQNAERIFGEITMDEIPRKCRQILGGDSTQMEKQLAENLLNFYNYKISPSRAFPPTIYWINGIDSVERIPEWMIQMLKESMDYNMLFIIMATSEFDQMFQVVRGCDYLFLGGTNSRIYDRLNVNYSHKAADCIALDLHIRSMDEDRSFKKFRCEISKAEAPSMPFDQILPMNL